ncbi:MAG: tRNA G46 methylase TrmB [Psychromonas sp.]|jgi:tRNA G46 methylase TrmB|uniref:tRNA (guanine(46)-N(7))-methyltransferase TrmB n=1 Tax=Psychromonas sp. TaxID=1884585 RepID=UPI0039E2E4DD
MSELGNSRVITSNQEGVHKDLEQVVLKHLKHAFRKPYQAHTLAAFKECEKWVEQQGKPIILDSCCGVGESTYHLAKKHPEAIILGLDKSADRLAKHPQSIADNYRLLQVNLNDFWRLAVDANWHLSHHYLLYPNPWPKANHLQRRWHGSAVFPAILALGGELELRSNWFTYIHEFARALELAKQSCHVETFVSETSITPFERKYWASGQKSLRLTATLK